MDNVGSVLVFAKNKQQFKYYEGKLKDKYKSSNIRYIGNRRIMDGLRPDKIELVGEYWLSEAYNSDCYMYYSNMIGEENISREFASV